MTDLTSNWWVISFVVVPVVLILVFGFKAVRRRHQVLICRAWAADHGMSYTRRDDRWVKAHDWGSPFGRGSGRRAIDVMTGPWRGRAAVVFTYRYSTSSPGPGDEVSTEYHYVSVHTITLQRRFPRLAVRPRGPFTPPVQGIAWPAADVLAMFLSVYDIRCDDLHFASDVLHPAMAWWMMTTTAVGFTIVDDRIVVLVGGRMDPERIGTWLDYLCAVLDRIPPTVGAG